MAMLVAERIERPPALFDHVSEEREPSARRDTRQRQGNLGGGPTLDDMLVGAWEGLTARVAVACPLCDGTLRPCGAGGAAGGRCGACGTTLD